MTRVQTDPHLCSYSSACLAKVPRKHEAPEQVALHLEGEEVSGPLAAGNGPSTGGWGGVGCCYPDLGVGRRVGGPPATPLHFPASLASRSSPQTIQLARKRTKARGPFPGGGQLLALIPWRLGLPRAAGPRWCWLPSTAGLTPGRSPLPATAEKECHRGPSQAGLRSHSRTHKRLRRPGMSTCVPCTAMRGPRTGSAPVWV